MENQPQLLQTESAGINKKQDRHCYFCNYCYTLADGLWYTRCTEKAAAIFLHLTLQNAGRFSFFTDRLSSKFLAKR